MRSPSRAGRRRGAGPWACRLGLALLAPLLSAGGGHCGGRHWEYRIRPEGRLLHRQLEEEKAVRSGTFGAVPPPGSQGGWALAHLETSLGTASAYAERFGGDPDQAAVLARARAGLDWTAGRVAAWMSYQLAGHPGAERVRAFILGQGRADLENALLVTYGLAARTAHADDGDAERRLAYARLLLLLVERGYLEPDQAGREASQGLSDGFLLALFRRAVARELGIDPRAPAPPELAFLESARGVEASLGAYRRATEIPDATRLPEGRGGLDLLSESLGEPVEWSLWHGGGGVSVHLVLPVEPFATSGAWNARAGAVQWHRVPVGDPGDEPFLVYAAWSVPDRDFQRARFGRVALEGEALYQYAAWRTGLDREHGLEWDAFLSGLTPGPGLWERIQAQRFRDDPAPGADGKRLADPARTALGAALKPPTGSARGMRR